MTTRGHRSRTSLWSQRLRQRFHRMATRRLTTESAILRRLGVRVEPQSADCSTGLLVIQIDGLSAPRLRLALARRTMPFLNRQVRQRRLVIQTYQSQIPTSTPAFQAGCFYGTNEGIPGFQFYDKRTQTRYRMGQTDRAREVQETLPGPGLLQGGSVYSCVFDGGAAGSLFIFSSLLDPTRWKFALRLWDLFVLTLLHLRLVIRVLTLALWELVLAVAEFPIWLKETGRLRMELQLILIRVGLLIIGREMITLNTIMDIQRGVPMIYTNFLGYDECSHIRGPDSATARLQLRAIDRCIRRIHRAILRADRPYQMILLSDHGQAACTPFAQITGQPVGPWLEQLLTRIQTTQLPLGSASPGETIRVDVDRVDDREAAMAEDQAAALRRIASRYPPLLRKPVDRVAAVLEDRSDLATIPHPGHGDIVVTISGPTAHVYWTAIPEALTRDDIQAGYPGLIESILASGAVGCVSVRGLVPGTVELFATEGSGTCDPYGVWTISGTLPTEATADPHHCLDGIRRVTLMDRSGDLILWGNGSPAGQISFLDERGCHTGFSDQETQAFVLAPPDCPVDFSSFQHHADFFQAFSQLRPPVDPQGAKG